MNDTLIVIGIGNDPKYVEATFETLGLSDDKDKCDYYYLIAQKKNDPNWVKDIIKKNGLPLTDNYYVDPAGSWAESLNMAFDLFEKSTAQWFVWIDCDMLFNHDWLAILKSVYNRSNIIKPVGIVNAIVVTHPKGFYYDKYEDYAITNYLVGNTMLFNRTNYLAVRGDPNSRCERWLAWIYLNKGLHMARPNASVAQHVGVGGLNMSYRKWKRNNGAENFTPDEAIRHLWLKFNQ